MEVLFQPAQAVPPHLTPEAKVNLLNHYLLVSHWRYRWYLDVLTSVKDTPKAPGLHHHGMSFILPLDSDLKSSLLQGRRNDDAHAYA